jgi:hypothetical protein
MACELYTLTEISRNLGRDYRAVRDRDSKWITPAAVVVVGGRERRLYKLEQFNLQPAAK